MKKIFLALAAMVCLTTASFAQDKKADKAKASTAKPAAAKKMDAAKPAPAVAPTKKDGTPDMRYKANKDAAKAAAGPLKKDGTPDMRYKANKDAASKKKG